MAEDVVDLRSDIAVDFKMREAWPDVEHRFTSQVNSHEAAQAVPAIQQLLAIVHGLQDSRLPQRSPIRVDQLLIHGSKKSANPAASGDSARAEGAYRQTESSVICPEAQKWLRLTEQLSPAFKPTPGLLQTLQSCPPRLAMDAL